MAVIALTIFEQFLIRSFTLATSEATVSSQSLGGTIHSASSGTKLWGGSIELVPNTHQTIRKLEALADQIMRPGNQFVFAVPGYDGPANKAAANLSNVQIDGTQSVGYAIRLKGLPANYKLEAGDLFSFQKNSTYRLYRITSDVTATAIGTATVGINIPLSQAGLPANDTAVQFIKPRMTAQYIPGSYQPGSYGLSYADGFSFQFVQALRVS